MSAQDKRLERPNLRHLRAFSLAVRERNISRAAELAHITQSAVSQAVGKLEQFYGCRLLDRGSAGVYPTALGSVAAERIDRALDQLRRATQRVSPPRGARAGELDRLLWANGHRPASISKFGTGLAALRPGLPRNKWSRVLRRHFDHVPARPTRAPSRSTR